MTGIHSTPPTTTRTRPVAVATRQRMPPEKQDLPALPQGEEPEPPATAALPQVTPPKAALLLMFMLYRRERREALLGDMEEDFQQALFLFGLRTAVWLYWKGVFCSLGPSLWSWLARGALLSKIVDFVHKFVA